MVDVLVVVVVVVVVVVPPGGIQTGVNCQISLQFRNELALRIAAEVRPNLLPIVVQVSPVVGTIYVCMQEGTAELDVLVDVLVDVEVEVEVEVEVGVVLVVVVVVVV